MKIHKVTIHNLNSLKGTHVVEFGKDPLASAGLFAITGPTGAGKTTILDAITLALFGKAARYGNVPSPEDVMTRGEVDCMAEVKFEVKTGIYIAQWELARARHKIDGKIQPPRRSIMTEGGKILAGQVKDVNAKIEELLGLDHERFMRSVMLAQGQFAKFLTSKPDERAQLLESLTGSEIYSLIGARVFEETGKIEQGILEREKKIQEIILLTEEARKEIEVANAEHEKILDSVRKELLSFSDLMAKIKQLEDAQKDQAEQSEQLDKAQKDQAAHADEFKSLVAHQETAPFTKSLTLVDDANKTLIESREAFSKTGKKLEQAKGMLSQAAGDYQAAIKLELKRTKEVIQQREKSKEQAEKAIAEIKVWLDEHKQDAQLADKLTQFSKLIDAKQHAEAKLESDWKEWAKAVKPLLPAPDLKSLVEGGLERRLAEIKQLAERAHGDAQSALAAAKETLKKSQQAREAALLLQKYEEDRALLVEGEPCALCGSIHHPYVGKDLKATAVKKFDKDITVAQQVVDKAEEALKEAVSLLTKVGDRGEKVQNAHQQSLQKAADCVQKLREAGLDGVDDTDTLQARANQYRAKNQELSDAQEKFKEALSDIQLASQQLKELEKREAAGLKLPESIKPSPASDEALEIDEAQAAFGTAFDNFNKEDARYEEATKKLKVDDDNYQKLAGELESEVAQSNFKTVKALREAHLPKKEVLRITEIQKGVEKRLDEAQTLLGKAVKTAQELISENVPSGTEAAKIKVRHAEILQNLQDITKAITSNNERLSIDATNHKEKKRLTAAMQDELKEVIIWRKIRDLIGSKDGAKFRKFAQSITLQILTSHANKHLGRLNDRYALLLQEGDTLELQIEDYYQAGIKRPLASLSGGESFLASLALALGLSDLAGRSVNIETLFIDEGFGTLDPETLEVALTALETLRQGNKSVGVISHVGLLKERITTQIVVTKGASGHSTLKVVS